MLEKFIKRAKINQPIAKTALVSGKYAVVSDCSNVYLYVENPTEQSEKGLFFPISGNSKCTAIKPEEFPSIPTVNPNVKFSLQFEKKFEAFLKITDRTDLANGRCLDSVVFDSNMVYTTDARILLVFKDIPLGNISKKFIIPKLAWWTAIHYWKKSGEALFEIDEEQETMKISFLGLEEFLIVKSLDPTVYPEIRTAIPKKEEFDFVTDCMPKLTEVERASIAKYRERSVYARPCEFRNDGVYVGGEMIISHTFQNMESIDGREVLFAVRYVKLFSGMKIYRYKMSDGYSMLKGEKENTVLILMSMR